MLWHKLGMFHDLCITMKVSVIKPNVGSHMLRHFRAPGSHT